jgi:hypothetical protein
MNGGVGYYETGSEHDPVADSSQHRNVTLDPIKYGTFLDKLSYGHLLKESRTEIRKVLNPLVAVSTE